MLLLNTPPRPSEGARAGFRGEGSSSSSNFQKHLPDDAPACLLIPNERPSHSAIASVPITSSVVDVQSGQHQLVSDVPTETSVNPGITPGSSHLLSEAFSEVLGGTGKFFLDVCCGKDRPFSKAALASGFTVLSADACFVEPVDILCDAHFELLLRFCFAGLVWFAMAGPHEAHLSHSQIPRLIQCFLHGSRNSPLRLIVVLHRCWQLFNVVARYVYSIIHSLQCGSYPWSNTFYSRFRRYVSLWTSHSGKAMTRALAFSLLHSKVYLSWASDVTSGERSDDVIQTGLQSSSIPVSFASATIEVLSSLQPASGPKDLTVTEAKQLLPSKPFGNPPFAFQDGGGIGSCPDWSCPPPGTPNVLLDLRQSWMSFLLRIKLPLRLRDFVRSGGEASLFTYEEIAELRGRFQLWARRNGGIAEVNWQVDDGQPYCLRALQTLSSLIMDKDTSLFPCLIEGVPTGFDKNIPKSNVFAPRESDSTIDAELLLCGGNWSSAEANPELLRQLVAKEVEAGYLVPVSLEEARQRWPNRLAVGKLSIVSSDRLVVDNSICNTNALCDINETYTLPLLGSVRACFPLRGLPCELAACTIDVKSAHKTMRVKHADQGLLGVQCDGQHYFYRVCPFGACFSALWWARLGSFFVRVLHLSIFVRHSLMLYVDGFFVTQDASTLDATASLILAFCVCFNIPLSWKKLCQVVWIGWCTTETASPCAEVAGRSEECAQAGFT